MEVTRLCVPRLTAALLLLVAGLDFSSARPQDARPFPRVVPNRQQHFKYDSLRVSCEGPEGLTAWRVMRRTGGVTTACKPPMSTSAGSCRIQQLFPAADSGEYWCEKPGGRSNTVNITVTDGPVILGGPVHPVVEGDAVTLSCIDDTSSNLTAEFFKDGVLTERSAAGNMTVHSVSGSYEGLYTCRISGVGESAASWLSVAGVSADDSVSLHVEPNKLQFFEYEPITVRCEGEGVACKSTSAMSRCPVTVAYKADSGLFWCEDGAGRKSRCIYIAVTDGPVILESPGLPVVEGRAETLRCRSKTTSYHTATFYKDGFPISQDSIENFIIDSVSEFDEGRYSCSISGVGHSAESWMSVRGNSKQPRNRTKPDLRYGVTEFPGLGTEPRPSSELLFITFRSIVPVVLMVVLLLLLGLIHRGDLRGRRIPCCDIKT